MHHLCIKDDINAKIWHKQNKKNRWEINSVYETDGNIKQTAAVGTSEG